MNRPLVLLCSPHPNGVSDTVAALFAQGMADAGQQLRLLPLRDYAFAPCTNCGGCAAPPHRCTLDTANDKAAQILQLILDAPLVLLSSPIYFYSLPAHFKALIDRSQRFWAGQAHDAGHAAAQLKPVLAALCAGRSRGNKLFAGALLTLKYFLAPLHAGIRETRLLRGLETTQDLLERPAVCGALRSWGHDWGSRLAALPHEAPHGQAAPDLFAPHLPELDPSAPDLPPQDR
ncbi:flavodoxin family protein [Desulfovibrio legallii]|jgi:NAD(P)H-dependent FMN reductase|uniref:NADPH-dependent FMN reductase n=1 Tax=Desulfovibrio legallii TaxID=571438 RepID=A0A1G7HZ83_9BACT|nr:flavodoxin family protein [Desulfovibrio legallii]SDF05613.1 NADPH-dependent FMN reductase [Desulfovibrio legallii]